MCFSTELICVMGSSKSKTTSKSSSSKKQTPAKSPKFQATPNSARISEKEIVVLKECRVELERIDVPSQKSKSRKINGIQDKPPSVKRKREPYHINLTQPIRSTTSTTTSSWSTTSSVVSNDESSTTGESIIDHGNGKLEYIRKAQSIQFSKCSVVLTRLEDSMKDNPSQSLSATNKNQKQNEKRSKSSYAKEAKLVNGRDLCRDSTDRGIKSLLNTAVVPKVVPLKTLLRRASSIISPKLPHEIELDIALSSKIGLPISDMSPSAQLFSKSVIEGDSQISFNQAEDLLQKQLAIEFIKEHILRESTNGLDNDWDTKMPALATSHEVDFDFGRADCLRGLDLQPISEGPMISLDEAFSDIMEIIKADTSVQVNYDNCEADCFCKSRRVCHLPFPEGQFPEIDVETVQREIGA